jgi:hypothetical protein
MVAIVLLKINDEISCNFYKQTLLVYKERELE